MIWFWIKDADVVHWLSQDDGGTYLHMVEMLGRAVLSTVGVLVREGQIQKRRIEDQKRRYSLVILD